MIQESSIGVAVLHGLVRYAAWCTNRAVGGGEALGDIGGHPSQLWIPILPFKLNQDRRRHIPRQRHRVTNSLGALLRSRPAYDASLRQRGSLIG